MTVFHSGHLFHLSKLSSQPYRGQKTLITVNIFPTIFSGNFSNNFFSRRYFPTPTTSSGAQRGDLQLFSKHRSQKPIHAPPAHCFSPTTWIPHAGTWPTFWCRASPNRLVRRRLALLSLRQSSLNPASPFFWHFSLRGSSFSLQRQLPSLAETCVCLGKASSSSPVTFLLCLGPDIPGSSSIAVIQPPFRALFDPNVIQSQVKWIWRLKILFLHPSSLDLLLSHRKN